MYQVNDLEKYGISDDADVGSLPSDVLEKMLSSMINDYLKGSGQLGVILTIGTKIRKLDPLKLNVELIGATAMINYLSEYLAESKYMGKDDRFIRKTLEVVYDDLGK